MKVKMFFLQTMGIVMILFLNMTFSLNAEAVKLNKDLIHEQDKILSKSYYNARLMAYSNAKYFGYKLDPNKNDFFYEYFNLALDYMDLNIPEYKRYISKYKGKKNKLRFNIATHLLAKGINLFKAKELVDAGIILENYIVRGSKRFMKYTNGKLSKQEILDRLTLESLLIVKGKVVGIEDLGSSKYSFTTSYAIKIDETIVGEKFDVINLVTVAGKNRRVIDGRHLSFKIGDERIFFLNRKHIKSSHGRNYARGKKREIQPIQKKRNTFYCLEKIMNLTEIEKKRVQEVFEIHDVKNLFNTKIKEN